MEYIDKPYKELYPYNICSTEIIDDLKKMITSNSYKRYINKYRKHNKNYEIKKPNCGLFPQIKNNLNTISTYYEKSFFISEVKKKENKLASSNSFHTNVFNLNFYEFLNEKPKDFFFTSAKKETQTINIMKIKEIVDLSKNKIKKVYNKESNRKTILKINSLKIRFISGDKFFKIKLPFEFIVIFGLFSNVTLMKLLSKCIILDTKAGVRLIPKDKIIAKLKDIISDDIDIDNELEKFNLKKKFKFYWFNDTEVFTVIISTPKIKLKICKDNLKFTKIIDPDFINQIYSKDFKNWEYYILNHLSMNKDFRKEFNLILSIHKYRNNNKSPTPVITYEGKEMALYSIYTDSQMNNYFLKSLGFSVESIRGNSNRRFNWITSLEMLKLRKKRDLEFCINCKVRHNNLTGDFEIDDNWLKLINYQIDYNCIIEKNNNKLLKIINPKIEWEYNENKGEYIIPDFILNKKDFDSIEEYFVFLSIYYKDIVLVKTDDNKSKNVGKKASVLGSRIRVSINRKTDIKFNSIFIKK